MPTKVHLVKAVVFPVVMYGCESWTVKKTERQRIDAFELLCWRWLFESPLDCKEIQPVHPKGDQSWIFIGSTDTEADAKLIQYFSHLMQRTDSLEKTLMLGKVEGGGEGDDRGWGGWMASLTQRIWIWVNSRSWWWTGTCFSLWGCKELDTTEQLNWTELTNLTMKKPQLWLDGPLLLK